MFSVGLAVLLLASAPGYHRALQYYEQRQFKLAEKELRSVLSSAPADSPARLYLARTLMQQGRLEEAVSEIQLALKNNKTPEVEFRAGELLRELANNRFATLQAMAPQSAAVREMAGNQLYRRGRTAEAITEYLSALKLEPNRPGINYRLGAAYWRLRDLDNAEASLSRELSLSPNHAMANLRLGQVLMAREEASKAVAPLEIAVRSGSVEAARELGKAYRKTGRMEEAAKQWQAVASERPGDDQIHFLLGRLYQELGRQSEAAAELRKHAEILARRRSRQPGSEQAIPGDGRP